MARKISKQELEDYLEVQEISLAYDTIHQKYLVKQAEAEDFVPLNLPVLAETAKQAIAEQIGSQNMALQNLGNPILRIANKSPINPIQLVLDNTQYDGSDQLEIFCAILSLPKDSYEVHFLKKWLCQNLYMLKNTNTHGRTSLAEGVLAVISKEPDKISKVFKALALNPENHCSLALTKAGLKSRMAKTALDTHWITEVHGLQNNTRQGFLDTMELLQAPLCRNYTPSHTSSYFLVSPQEFLKFPMDEKGIWGVSIPKVQCCLLKNLNALQLYKQVEYLMETESLSFRLNSSEELRLFRFREKFQKQGLGNEVPI